MLPLDKILSEIFEVSAQESKASLLTENTNVLQELPENFKFDMSAVESMTLSEDAKEAVQDIVARVEKLKSFMQ